MQGRDEMASRDVKTFDLVLQRLFRARTFRIRSYVSVKRGRAPNLSRHLIRTSIERLQDIVEGHLLISKHVRAILKHYSHKKQWHAKRGKGHGTIKKAKAFKNWYDDHVKSKNCVYQFWDGKRCLYVGRTLNGKGRPTSHFEKRWFGRTTRVDVYAFTQKRNVPRFECLLTHRDGPVFSRIRPSAKRYFAKCPICEARSHIKRAIANIFRLR